ncbi:PREDICTED: multiple epidermal growth factor-like domains protein 10 [Priapulus caudatus]|uniref:Multiple epidermal growth factor-like domains protein 10 n=1 Tax=Priapulus caudatus TaxID=37621 RepID=A0ABM1F4A8_PRICU|nr:PREDICTED: multiple epidermal growth factor-like domains protein 10 [Priapulus caudatus]
MPHICLTYVVFSRAECPSGKFGVDCVGLCHCKDGAQCAKVTGDCPLHDCAAGWGGAGCQAFSCVGREQDRSYVDPFDCTHYYTCTSNPVRRCPRGQSFDDRGKVCNFNSQVDCSDFETQGPACDDPAVAGAYREKTRCSRYRICMPDPRQKCPPGELWNDDMQDCVFVYDVKCGNRKDREVIEHNRISLKFSCGSTPDGYYLHPSYCTMYRQCDRGRGFLLPCPTGLYWEESRKTCVKQEEASCLMYDENDELF